MTGLKLSSKTGLFSGFCDKSIGWIPNPADAAAAAGSASVADSSSFALLHSRSFPAFRRSFPHVGAVPEAALAAAAAVWTAKRVINTD